MVSFNLAKEMRGYERRVGCLHAGLSAKTVQVSSGANGRHVEVWVSESRIFLTWMGLRNAEECTEFGRYL